MIEELAALASTAATTVVAAMATGAWDAARAGLTRLLGAGSAQRQAAVEAQLDDHAELVAAATAAEDAQIRGELAPVWRRQLERFLTDHAAAAAELRGLTDQIRAALPAEQRQWADTIVQNNIANGPGAMAAGIVGAGNITFHGAGAAAPQPPDRRDTGEGR